MDGVTSAGWVIVFLLVASIHIGIPMTMALVSGGLVRMVHVPDLGQAGLGGGSAGCYTWYGDIWHRNVCVLTGKPSLGSGDADQHCGYDRSVLVVEPSALN